MKTEKDIRQEMTRILTFINNYVYEDEKVVIPVSGGLDSDVVARLCCKALGKDRVHLFAVHQPHMEKKYLNNIENLGRDLGIKPVVIDLENMNVSIIRALSEAEKEVTFNPFGLLDSARANCSLRTALISSYQDKGFVVAANSNRSELQLGFFMPFGDNLGHFKPIAHLYKSEVRILAGMLGCRREVLAQPPSAGFWENEEDLEDLAFWLYNGGPVSGECTFTERDCENVMLIKKELTQFKVDACLEMLSEGKDNRAIQEGTGLPLSIVSLMRSMVEISAKFKNRKLLTQLERN